MEFILYGLIIASLAVVPLFFDNERIVTRIGTALFCWFFIWATFGYVATPHLIGPLFGAGLIVPVTISWATTTLALFGRADHTGKSGGGETIALRLIALLGVCVFLGTLAEWSAFRSSSYRAFVADNVQEKEWHDDLPIADTAHIRQVSSAQAAWSAGMVLGNSKGSLGSRYKLGRMTIQRVRDELKWVVPLEYQDFRSWSKFGSTPGYIMVSAEDPFADAELVTGYEFRYMPSGFFGSNLERHLYTNRHQFKGVTDFTFEIDDEGNPYWVVTVYKPTISWSGHAVQGVVLVDPQTGELQSFTAEDAPEWVDRFLPAKFALDRLTWYGRFVKGWFNSWWGEEDVHVPTDVGPPGQNGDLWVTWGADGRAHWFTGLTSSKTTDQSLVGFAMMDTRTEETKTYRLSGGDETAVIQAVNASVSNFDGYYATRPILYNIYGELTWVVPVVSGKGMFQRLALVHATSANLKVSLGKNKSEALSQFRRDLQEGSNRESPSLEGSLASAAGRIVRLGDPVINGETVYHFVLDDDPTRIYSGTAIVSPELPIARVGEQVRVRFLETNEAVVPISRFSLVPFEARVTPVQEEANRRYDAAEAGAQKRNEAMNIRARMGNMTDDELLRTYGEAGDRVR